MNVLIISPTPTHPTNQGNRVRVMQIGSALLKYGAQVDLLYYGLDGIDSQKLDEMRSYWRRVYVVSHDGSVFRRRFPDAWGIDDWICPSLISACRLLSSTNKYDIVIVNYVWCSACLEVFPDSTVKIIDTHDAFGDRHVLSRRLGINPSWYYTSIQQEAIGLGRADYIVAIQESEGEYFRGITRSNVQVIEYAPEPCFLPAQNRKVLTIGYLGSNNPWNVKSVEEFDKHVYSRFKDDEQAPCPQFLLFGSVTKSVKDLKVFQSMGMVDKVSSFYSSCDIAVNPMIGGTGLKIKTVEALSFGRPIITTYAGAAGLSFISDDFVCDDASEVASIVYNISKAGGVSSDSLTRSRVGYLRYHEDVCRRMDDAIAMWVANAETNAYSRA